MLYLSTISVLRNSTTHVLIDSIGIVLTRIIREPGKPMNAITGRERDPVFEKVRHAVSAPEWALMRPTIDAITRLKRERNAVILAHNYMSPAIYHGVADIVGDSLALAAQAVEAQGDVIVMAGVHFMAETAKLLNPAKTVLMPDLKAGCSLAESITGADVRALRARHPGVPVVAYVNTSADVKAEVDICCTSGNAVKVVESLNAPEVIFLPDKYLAAYVASQTSVRIIPWDGRCEVHEQFTAADIAEFRAAHDDLTVIAHPECPPDVLAAADFAGSTAQMQEFVRTRTPKTVFMVTECSMSDNITAESPQTTFVRPCMLCPHMQRITLDNIRTALETLEPRVEIPADVAARARASVERMLAVGR
ncbi:quinolinate synthetase [Caenispirillum bisanense]|uniref:Quinolinate synthase n=2 Tax=Caenispirillum bisanense TaxID=414052 RepID=A0A286G9Z2_9PROT|nr:quinolinate synthetase [Caenispirillum bisanense]